MVDRRYFVIEGGPVMEKIEETLDAREEVRKKQVELSKEIGSENLFGYIENDHTFRVVGVAFDADPGRYWRKRDDHWRPDRRYREGKALADKLRAVSLPGFSDAMKIADPHRSWIFGTGRAHITSIGQIGGQWVLSVPVTPEKDYTPPVEGLREVSLSEWYALKAEAEERKEAA